MSNYQGFPPGFEVGLDLPDEQDAWREWLGELGYGPFTDGGHALATEPERPAEHGVSAFMTDKVIEWLGRQDGAWFAHASYWRPHPPYAAAGHWSKAYDPDDVGLPVGPPDRELPFCGRLMDPAPADERQMREIRAQYYGMVSDVDHELGRLFDAIDSARHVGRHICRRHLRPR